MLVWDQRHLNLLLKIAFKTKNILGNMVDINLLSLEQYDRYKQKIIA